MPSHDFGGEYDTYDEALAAGVAWVDAMTGGADGRWFLFPPGLRWEFVEIEGGAIKRATNSAILAQHRRDRGNFAWLADVNFDDLTPANDEQAAAVLAAVDSDGEKIAVFKLTKEPYS
jgi:hypothetical protein